MRYLLLVPFTVPQDFLWGASTSGHQTEGGNASSDWRVLENAPGSFIVTENGIATSDDAQRVACTAGALDGLRSAMDDGIRVDGYFHWSLLDNHEWGD